MNIVQKQLVKLTLSRSGPLVQKILTAAAAAIATWVSSLAASKVPFLAPIIAEHFRPEVVLLILWGGIDLLVSKLPSDIISEYGKQLQTALNRVGAGLKIDGFVGPITVARAEAITTGNVAEVSE